MLLAIDAGSTSLRSLLVSTEGAVLGSAQLPCAPTFPAPGRVEHDPEQLGSIADQVVEQALAAAGASPGDLAAVGITSQRSCVVIWERDTVRPLTPLVSWQDLRGIDRALELQAQGFPVVPQAAAAKLESVLDQVPSGRQRAESTELAWGGVESYLLARWSDAHATDASHASATGAWDLTQGDWDDNLLAALGLPRSFFPAAGDTAGHLATTTTRAFGAEVPVTAVVADQQSATLAHGLRLPGEGKVTYGTSATANIATGAEVCLAAGVYPLALWQAGDQRDFCLEGMVLTAGAWLDWLASHLARFDSAAALAAAASTVEDSGGVAMLPALLGLGSPHGDPDRRARITGVGAATTGAHLARASLEAIAFRVRELLDAIHRGAALPEASQLHVDGGAARSDALLQIQADVLGRPVARFAEIEATAWGAIACAGYGLGLWSTSPPWLRRSDRVFEPRWSADQRQQRFDEWRKAVGVSQAEEEPE